MQIHLHDIGQRKIAEVQGAELLIQSAEDGLDLLGDLYYQEFDGIIWYEQQISPDFFDLKNGMAGKILQKFSNYRMRLAIIGDFHAHTSKSIRDFRYESNQKGQINFVNSLDQALQVLSR